MSPKCRFGPSRQRSPRGHRGKGDRPRPPRTRAPAEKKQASREPAFEKMPNRRELRAAPCFRPKKINGRSVWLRERRDRRPPTRFKNVPFRTPSQAPSGTVRRRRTESCATRRKIAKIREGSQDHLHCKNGFPSVYRVSEQRDVREGNRHLRRKSRPAIERFRMSLILRNRPLGGQKKKKITATIISKVI